MHFYKRCTHIEPYLLNPRYSDPLENSLGVKYLLPTRLGVVVWFLIPFPLSLSVSQNMPLYKNYYLREFLGVNNELELKYQTTYIFYISEIS